MSIGKRLNSGFLAVCSLILIVGLLGLILSMQVRGLRNVELPMEQNLREVEVSIWEAIHAANAFRLTGTPYYEELYHKQLADVNEFFPRYEALIDTEEEKAYIREFNVLWNEAKAAGDKMIALTKAQEEQEKLFFEAVDGADEVIDSDIQPKWPPDDPHRLAKEQAVREVEVSIWEAIHAAHQYVGLSGEVHKFKDLYAGGTKEVDFAKLMTKQFGDVDEFWTKYKALATARWEKEAIAKFDGFWKQTASAGNEMLRLHGEADGQFKILYEKVDKADDVIDYKMQAYIQKRIERADLTAERIRNITIAVVLFSLFFAVVISMRITRSIARPIKKLKEAADEIGKGRLDAIVEVGSKDELGDLAAAFNKMAALRRSAEEVARSAHEELLKKSGRLELFQQVAVDREMMMVEMKAEVNGLLERLGEPRKYAEVDSIKKR